MLKGGYETDDLMSGRSSQKDFDEKTKAKDSLDPVVIKWVARFLESRGTDDTFRCQGKVMERMLVVGRVCCIERETAKVLITVDDGTGLLTIVAITRPDAEELPSALRGLRLE